MTYRNAVLIYNPNAGGFVRGRKDLIGRILESLCAHGHQVKPMPTSEPGEATEFARQAVSSGADLVLVAGGDGTINEALNGMVGSATPLAVLPAGTANVLAMEMGIGHSMHRVVTHLHKMVPVRIAVGLLRAHRAPERYFLLMAGVGLDADVVQCVDLTIKKLLGKVAYYLAASTKMGAKLPQLELLVNGESRFTGFALASRVRNYGGDLSIARTASLLEDCFEVVDFEGDSTLPYVKYLTGVVAGNLANMRGVHVVKAQRVEFHAPLGVEIAVQVDGEFAGGLPASVEIVPDAITLLWTTSPTR